MKNITIKDIVSHISQKDFEEHLDPMQLTLFKDNLLSEKEREEIFEHLAQCKRCRDVLQIASELEQEETTVKPVNNPYYKGMIKHFMPFAAAVVIFLGVPQGDKYFNEDMSAKSVFEEKNIFEESIEYWEELFEKLFKGE